MTAPVPPSLDALRPRIPSPLDEVADDRLARLGVRLSLKRDDLIHPLPKAAARTKAARPPGAPYGAPLRK
jgi:hypothetical protein